MALTRLYGLSIDRVAGQGGGTVGITGPFTVTGTVVHTGGKTVRQVARMYHTGSAIFTGGNVNRIVGRLQVTGSVVVTGGATCKLKLRSNGTGAICGVRTIATAASAVITTTKLSSSSVILLTPLMNTGLNAMAYERYSVRSAAAGTFKIILDVAGVGTAPTGRVAWMIVN